MKIDEFRAAWKMGFEYGRDCGHYEGATYETTPEQDYGLWLADNGKCPVCSSDMAGKSQCPECMDGE